jgi:hypothetical protein
LVLEWNTVARRDRQRFHDKSRGNDIAPTYPVTKSFSFPYTKSDTNTQSISNRNTVSLARSNSHSISNRIHHAYANHVSFASALSQSFNVTIYATQHPRTKPAKGSHLCRSRRHNNRDNCGGSSSSQKTAK